MVIEYESTLQPKREGARLMSSQESNHEDCAVEQEHVYRVEKINQFPSPGGFHHKELNQVAHCPQEPGKPRLA